MLQQSASDRRGILALLVSAGAAISLPASSAAAAAAPARAAAPSPLPVPPLTETYVNAEGFKFNYPPDWVVAFDRTGSSGNGAVIVVGDFRALITVSVFRTTTVAEAVLRAGLSEENGYEICVEPQQRQAMRFQLLRSTIAAAAAAGAGDGAAREAEGSVSAAYDFEYSLESCQGEVEEGLGGTLRCLGPFNNVIPSQRRHHIGRCLLINGKAYSLNANTPEDRWVQVGPILQAVVDTFGPA
ncbi:hypothetical protein D9Q98_008036 [Chlorella vulgaris]|uniref:PsbP C-terminal domain-containing protein n=1 Tax=Chlorella vulgaris TaxID=3077 RepID=A0A9D4TI17_CHLVU|nr:hypothetical protein D9Q98_008036 [Chlorella vulgaris]